MGYIWMMGNNHFFLVNRTAGLLGSYLLLQGGSCPHGVGGKEKCFNREQ